MNDNENESFRRLFISALACFENHTTEFIEKWMKISGIATERDVKTTDDRYGVFPKAKRFAEYMTRQTACIN